MQAETHARPGRIAEAILNSATASPVILLDEFDKAAQLNVIDRPFDIFHTLFEEENSVAFRDDFLEFPLRADHVIWIATANSTLGIPSPILDLLLVIRISPPAPYHRDVVTHGIYQDFSRRYDGQIADRLSNEVMRILGELSPRHVKQILNRALGFAVHAGRTGLLDDVRRALQLLPDRRLGGTFDHPAEFTGRSC